MILLWLLACGGPDERPPPPGDSGVEPVGLVLDPVMALPQTTEAHHITVALRPDATALAVYSDGSRLRAARIDDQPEPTAFDAGANHGQVRATPDGWAVVATLDGALALAGQALDADGAPLAPAELLGVDHPYLPDLATGDLGGFVVATDLLQPACATFLHPLHAVAPAPCPARVDPEAAFGTVTAALGPDGPVVAWTELRPDGALTVHLAPPDAPPFLAGEAAWGASMAGRPMLAVDGERLVLVWRGAASPDAPVRSHLAAFAPDGAALGAAWELGDAASERPALAGPVDGLYAVAWEEADRLWLQLRRADDLAPVGDPIALDDEPDRIPRRPALDLVLGDAGPEGIVTWEAAEPGAEVEADGRQGRVRRWRVGGRGSR